MEFNFNDETRLYAHKDNEINDVNSYLILSKDEDVKDTDFQSVIQIIDETGTEVSCTYDKFVEIFDEEGLSGFIL
jgi:oligoendopeptidase F